MKELNSVLPASINGCGRSRSMGWRASTWTELVSSYVDRIRRVYSNLHKGESATARKHEAADRYFFGKGLPGSLAGIPFSYLPSLLS